MAAPNNPARGEAHYNSKITDDDCRLIMALVDERNELLRKARELTDAKIAAKFEVHKHTVWKIGQRAARVDALMKQAQRDLPL